MPASPLAALLVLFASAIGCKRELECRAEVTTGSGIFRGMARAADEAAARRASIGEACAAMCAAAPAAAGGDGCAAGCRADAELGKIGLRATCSRPGEHVPPAESAPR